MFKFISLLQNIVLECTCNRSIHTPWLILDQFSVLFLGIFCSKYGLTWLTCLKTMPLLFLCLFVWPLCTRLAPNMATYCSHLFKESNLFSPNFIFGFDLSAFPLFRGFCAASRNFNLSELLFIYLRYFVLFLLFVLFFFHMCCDASILVTVFNGCPRCFLFYQLCCDASFLVNFNSCTFCFLFY